MNTIRNLKLDFSGKQKGLRVSADISKPINKMLLEIAEADTTGIFPKDCAQLLRMGVFDESVFVVELIKKDRSVVSFDIKEALTQANDVINQFPADADLRLTIAMKTIGGLFEYEIIE